MFIIGSKDYFSEGKHRMSKTKQAFSKIWSIEEDNYEAAANQFTLKCQLISLLLLVIMWILNQLDIFIIDKQIMTTAMISCYCIEAMTILCCAMFGYEKWWMKYVILFFSVLMSTMAGIFLTYHVVLACVLPLLYSMQYRKRRMVYYTYILTFFSMMAIVLIGYYEGICDANMILLTTGNIFQYVDFETRTIIYDTINSNPLAMLPLYYVLPRMIILSAMIPVMQHVVKTATKHAAVESELKRLSEIDEMTHLYNRNKYNQMLVEYFPKIEQVAVIFWDLNGLKKTNDNLGHEAGDYLITVFAKTIFNLSETHRFAYRIGGDEFVLIIENPRVNEKELVLTEWRQSMESMNRSSKIPISASVGYAVGKGMEIENLITQADQMMYAEKTRTKSGRDV